MKGAQSDFSVVGVSSETAMTSFVRGKASITSGTVFTQGSDAYECIITQEPAAFNDISVGDTVTFTNPNNEEETYDFKVTGIFSVKRTGKAKAACRNACRLCCVMV